MGTTPSCCTSENIVSNSIVKPPYFISQTQERPVAQGRPVAQLGKQQRMVIKGVRNEFDFPSFESSKVRKKYGKSSHSLKLKKLNLKASPQKTKMSQIKPKLFNNLSILDFAFYEAPIRYDRIKEEEEVNRLMLNLTSHNKVSKLTLRLQINLHSSCLFQNISFAFKELSSLSSLTLCIKNGSDYITKTYKDFSLFINLKYLPCLSSLTLKISNLSNLDEILKKLLSGIKRLSSLSSLALHFNRIKSILPSTLEGITQLFRATASLSILAISFENTTYPLIQNKKEFLNSLSLLKHLTSLSLNLGSLLHISDTEVILNNLSGLTSLSLHFIVHGEFSFRPNLQLSDSLSNIALHFELIRLSSSALTDQLLLSLEQLKPLQTLVLSYYDCGDMKNHLKSIASRIESLKSLSAFALRIDGKCDIDNDDLKTIASTIKQKSSLSKLELKFANAPKITDGEVSCLLLGLEKCHSLRDLVLNFSVCMHVGNKTISGLSSALKHLSYLETLSLSFSCCGEFGYSELKDFSLSVGAHEEFIYGEYELRLL